VRRTGLATRVFSDMRSLQVQDYASFGAANGLMLTATPGVQDVEEAFPNLPWSFDFVLKAPAKAATRREILQARFHGIGEEPEAFLRRLLRACLPRLACEAVVGDWLTLEAAGRARLLGLCELAMNEEPDGRVLDEAAAAMAGDAADHAYFQGLRALAAGQLGEALANFRRAAKSHEDALPLAGSCLLRRRDSRALDVFRGLLGRQPDRVWSVAGFLLAALNTGDRRLIRKAVRMTTERLESGIVTRC